jgi:hypothetical protein
MVTVLDTSCGIIVTVVEPTDSVDATGLVSVAAAIETVAFVNVEGSTVVATASESSVVTVFVLVREPMLSENAIIYISLL